MFGNIFPQLNMPLIGTWFKPSKDMRSAQLYPILKGAYWNVSNSGTIGRSVCCSKESTLKRIWVSDLQVTIFPRPNILFFFLKTSYIWDTHNCFDLAKVGWCGSSQRWQQYASTLTMFSPPIKVTRPKVICPRQSLWKPNTMNKHNIVWKNKIRSIQTT